MTKQQTDDIHMYIATINCYNKLHCEAVDLLTFSDLLFDALNELSMKYERKAQLIFECLKYLNLHETNLRFLV